MSDSRHPKPLHTHLYNRHLSAIYSQHPQLDPRLVQWVPLAPSLSAPLHAAPPQTPTFLLLHPAFARNRTFPLVPLHPAAAAAHLAHYPAVIVSPHYSLPTSEREHSHPAVKSSFTSSTSAPTHLHENSSTSHGAHHSAPSMTSHAVGTMGNNRREERAPMFSRSQKRPSLVSQHSNSVPSTPLQLARQYESRSRSPSPNGGLGSHSPRSVSSEANGAMPTLRAPRPNSCRFETSTAFGRRRMPYTSSDILEKPKEEPKKTLDPHEDEKLSGDMRELYDRLLPSDDDAERRQAFVKKLENILHTEFPGNEFKVHVFGSSGNMLYTSESDVDICIQTPMKRLEEMHMLAEALDKHGMKKVVCIPQAKVRIVKMWDPELRLNSDMNVNNTLALENTRMIKTYVQIDERVRPLAMIIKYWAKQRILNDAATGGTISSYTWICMILNFLQTRDPPIIPSLHKLPCRKVDEATGKPSESEFADDLDKLKGFGEKNKESLGQLLFQFFRLYGYELDYEKRVISVREGRLLTREEKMWHLVGLKKEARNRLCVEEPFNTDRNLGNSADDFAWRGIHLELRRAFDLLADHGQLAKACEQYEFPNEEKTTIFKKPTATVKPVLQSAPSVRSGRGGSSQRSNRGGPHQRNAYVSPRRASSSASFGVNRPPFLAGNQVSLMDYGLPPRGHNEQLHDQLMNQYLALEMQSFNLKAQFNAQRSQQHQQQHQQQQQQQHARAAQAQMQAFVANQDQTQGQGHSRGQGGLNGPSQNPPFVNGPSSPQVPDLTGQTFHPQYLFPFPAQFDPSQLIGPVSQDGPRTNPSSPSLNNSLPRRSVHRISNASDSGSIRSQSQPARGVPQPQPQPQPQPHLLPTYPPLPQYVDPSAYPGYPIPRSTQDSTGSLPAPETSYNPASAYQETAASLDQSTPKEYVGYYLAEQPEAPVPSHVPSYSVQQIPTYQELVQRRTRAPPEITQPLLNTALRRISRSPSPLGAHARSYSTGVTPPSVVSQRKDSNDPVNLPRDDGPLIVNGSFPIREARSQSDTMEAFPSFDTPHSPSLGMYAGSDPFANYNMVSTAYGQQSLPEVYQVHDLPVNMIHTGPWHGNVNGSSSDAANGLSRVQSGERQPFPTVEESWMNPESPKDDSKSPKDTSPVSLHSPQKQPASLTNGLNRLDTNSVPRDSPQETKSAGAPLLSPVFEARTPSPTASRHQDRQQAANGSKSKESQGQQPQPQQPLQPRSSQASGHAASSGQNVKDNSRVHQHKVASQGSEKNSKSAGGATSASTGGWQPSKKSKKKKGANKSAEQKTTGEPLPPNAADRKGG